MRESKHDGDGAGCDANVAGSSAVPNHILAAASGERFAQERLWVVEEEEPAQLVRSKASRELRRGGMG